MAIDVRVLGLDDADLLETVAPDVFANAVDRKLARELLGDGVAAGPREGAQ